MTTPTSWPSFATVACVCCVSVFSVLALAMFGPPGNFYENMLRFFIFTSKQVGSQLRDKGGSPDSSQKAGRTPPQE